jgi:hypothetical protein
MVLLGLKLLMLFSSSICMVLAIWMTAYEVFRVGRSLKIAGAVCAASALVLGPFVALETISVVARLDIPASVEFAGIWGSHASVLWFGLNLLAPRLLYGEIPKEFGR